MLRRLDDTMLADRPRLRRELRQAMGLIHEGREVTSRLERIAQGIEASTARLQQRLEGRPAIIYPPELPVSQRRDELADAIRKYQVTIVCGATGSGKTTQLPKLCLEIGRGMAGMIGHTQPRRLAARSVARRIADELHTPMGDLVGYKVRFSDHLSPHSLIKLMTDGILLAEIQSDRMLWQYDTLILDEAHERSLNIDFLLGYLKRLLPRRPDLKLIITSATIAPERFSRHFDDAPIVNIEGRTYPVEVRYRPVVSESPEEADLEQGRALLRAVDELWQSGPGDTLIFLPGERDIRNTAELLRKHHPKGVDILPLYARLSSDEQMRVFNPHDRPRIILATNIAETSLTVPGIKYVIDQGTARISRYSGRGSVQRLPIEPISRASADQRKGRCGRLSPGVCIRLYDEAAFNARPEYTDPEIWRTNLASVILQMKALRLGRIEEFPFLDPPDYRQIRDGYQTLYELGAIDEQNELTTLGLQLARLPIDPRIARMVLASQEHRCLGEVLIIAAALSIQDPRERPLDQQSAADSAHAEFRDPSSDFLTLLKLWSWYQQQQKHLSENKLRKLCRDKFLSFSRLREWQEIHSQLKQLAFALFPNPSADETFSPAAIHQSVLAGLLSNIGVKGEDFEYQGPRGRRFFIFPGSTQFSRKPQWIVAAELVQTSRLYARTVAPVQPEWIERAAAHMVHRDYTDPHWLRRRGQVVAHERVTFQNLILIPRRTIDYAPVDPRTSRELFIQGALVLEDFDCDAPFFRHNGRLRRHIESLEARQRKRDLLADHKSIFAFYDALIPALATSADAFNRWRHHAEQKDRRILFMQESDLLIGDACHITEAQFPSTLQIADSHLAIDYRFEAGHPSDGITLRVPVALLPQLDQEPLDWLVPGMLRDKVIDLIRTLPKELRTRLLPHAQSADAAIARMPFGQGCLYRQLAFELGRLIGESFDPRLFKPQTLAPYLQMNLHIVDAGGKTLAAGRDLAALRTRLRVQARSGLQQRSAQWRRDNIKSWDFGDLPDKVEIRTGPLTLACHPALIDNGTTASLRLMDHPLLAAAESRRGVRRLAQIALTDALNWQFKILPQLDKLLALYKPLGNKDQLRETFTLALTDHLIFAQPTPVRTRLEFELRLDNAWNHLRPEAEKLATLAQQILAARNDLAAQLSRDFAPLLQGAIADMRTHLARLCPSNFLLVHPWQWLMHLPRFIQGIRIRLQRLTNAGLLKDSHNAGLIAPLIQTLHERQQAAKAAGVPDPNPVEFHYLIEELRISLFAQELKTSVPVSVQKLQKQLAG